MVYVDSPIFKKSPNGRKSYCHMVADSISELHLFAEQIGVKKHFYHRARYFHYDLTSDQHVVAVAQGAKEVSSREILEISKLMMKNKN